MPHLYTCANIIYNTLVQSGGYDFLVSATDGGFKKQHHYSYKWVKSTLPGGIYMYLLWFDFMLGSSSIFLCFVYGNDCDNELKTKENIA